MNDLEWNRKFPPETTFEELDKYESELQVKIPSVLRELWTTCSPTWAPMRSGEDASFLIVDSGKVVNKGSNIALFYGFCSPGDNLAIDYLEDQHNIHLKRVIPFGHNGSSQLFLNYDNDPTGQNPEIWDTYLEGDTPEEAWRLVAPDISTFFSNLKTKTEAEELGVY